MKPIRFFLSKNLIANSHYSTSGTVTYFSTIFNTLAHSTFNPCAEIEKKSEKSLFTALSTKDKFTGP